MSVENRCDFSGQRARMWQVSGDDSDPCGYVFVHCYCGGLVQGQQGENGFYFPEHEKGGTK